MSDLLISLSCQSPWYLQAPLLRLQVENYLDEHPEFLESYLQRKGEPRHLARLLGTRLAEAKEERRPPNLSINDEPLLSRSDSRYFSVQLSSCN